MSVVLISGSSRKNGDTAQITQFIQTQTQWDLIDLNDYQFSYYDYEHQNATDDFLPLMETIVSNYQTLVLATPVYWYSMSGIMKVFFDRITDLVTIRKDLGRALKGRHMAAISSSGGNNLGKHFWLPFALSANYLEMTFIDGLHTHPNGQALGEEDCSNIQAFIQKIQQVNR